MTVLTSGGSTARRSEGTSFESSQSGELSGERHLEKILAGGKRFFEGLVQIGFVPQTQ